MKEKNKINRFLFFLALISFVVASFEGFLYYADTPLFFRVLLILQNSIQAFAFKSEISLKDTISFMQTDPDSLKTVAGYAYSIAVFTAPYCTIAAIYRFMSYAAHFLYRLRKHRDFRKIIIFGYNDEVKSLINSYSGSEGTFGKLTVHIAADRNFSNEEHLYFHRRNCVLHSADLIGMNDSERKDFLRKNDISEADDLILFEESSVKNFSLLQMFCLFASDSENTDDERILLKKGAKVTCRCEDDGIASLIDDYYQLKPGRCFAYDLEVVSIPELQIRNMFEQRSLHTYYLDSDTKCEDWNVHMLIAGFNKLGQQALLQAVNLAPVHKNNSVVIDVVDIKVEERIQMFSKLFDTDTFDIGSSCIKMKHGAADGQLTINFYNMDVRHRKFRDFVKSENTAMPFTYVLIAIDDADTGADCALHFSSVFDDNTHTPVFLRMDKDRMLAEYIKKNRNTLADVRVLDGRSEHITMNMVLRSSLYDDAKKFNHLYSGLRVIAAGGSTESISDIDDDSLWNSISMFRRESSKALAVHLDTKRVVFERIASDLGYSSVHDKIKELVGPEGSLMRYSGSADNIFWILEGSECEFTDNVLADEFAYNAASMEHRRWCYSAASRGWRYGEHRSDRKKIHNFLMNFDEMIRVQKETGVYTVQNDLMSLLAEYIDIIRQ